MGASRTCERRRRRRPRPVVSHEVLSSSRKLLRHRRVSHSSSLHVFSLYRFPDSETVVGGRRKTQSFRKSRFYSLRFFFPPFFLLLLLLESLHCCFSFLSGSFKRPWSSADLLVLSSASVRASSLTCKLCCFFIRIFGKKEQEQNKRENERARERESFV